MPRTSSHVIETRARDYLREKINSFYENGDALFREITERDYGIDAIIELFHVGIPTGMIAMVQIKGTENIIKISSNNQYVSCRISSSNAYYALQNNIPIILTYIYIGEPSYFYYVKVQDAITAEKRQKIEKQETINIRIPVENKITEDLDPIFELIRNSYRGI